MHLILKRLLWRWKYGAIILMPLALLPILILVDTKEAKCSYALLLISLYWIFEVVPLSVTSLLPAIILPLLGVMNSDEVCRNYFKESNMMILSSMMAALGVENSNLHQRIALKTLLIVGSSKKWLLFGVITATVCLSMWISNTATTAMMIPIVESILHSIDSFDNSFAVQDVDFNSEVMPQVSSEGSEISVKEISSQETLYRDDAENRTTSATISEGERIRKCFLLAVAYGASLGGIGTLIGSGSNVILMEIISSAYGTIPGFNFATWLIFTIPIIVISGILSWLWLLAYLEGPSVICHSEDQERSSKYKKVIKQQYDELGSLSFHEIVVLILFLLLILLWIFRQPEVIPGWGTFFPSNYIKDSAAGFLVVFLMFVLPSTPDFIWRNLDDETHDRPPKTVLTWNVIQQKIPWGVLILRGGGYALAEATKTSGLSIWIGQRLELLRYWNPIAVVFAASIFVSLFTEIMNNSTLALIILPVMVDLAEVIQTHPLYLMIPVTLCCSFAFMLPIGSTQNALVFEVGNMKVVDMAKPGVMMNIICVGVSILMMNTLGVYVFNLDSYPTWASNYTHIDILNATETID